MEARSESVLQQPEEQLTLMERDLGILTEANGINGGNCTSRSGASHLL